MCVACTIFPCLINNTKTLKQLNIFYFLKFTHFFSVSMKSAFTFTRQVCTRPLQYCILRKFSLRRCFSTLDSGHGDETTEKPQESPLQDLLDDSALGTGPLDEVDETDEWRTSPYPAGAVINPRQSQSLKSLRPRVDPQDTSVILFPGQGSQYVGMGKELLKFPAARDIFEAANQILQFDLLKLMLKGPKHQLDQTKYCQPAVVVCSLAALEKLKEERPSAIENCIATAGFSVGEITALTFAGVFKFGDAIKLVRTRAEAMQLASELEPGGMATVVYGADSKLSLAIEKAKEWCSDRGINKPECKVATYLHPHMKVVAGHLEALRYLECNKAFFKLNEVKKLPVRGAFHTNLMLSATSAFREKLKKLEIMEPMISVHSNVNGEYYRDQAQILAQLPRQIHKPIKWEQMLHILYERDPECSFPETIFCGPPNPLKEYLRQVNAKAAEALQFLTENMSAYKLRKIIPVPVTGAFHTDLMIPAVKTFSEILKETEMYEPSAYIYSNVDGRPYKNLEHIQKQLPKQIYKPVLWEQLIQSMYKRDRKVEFPSTYTCGPKGDTLASMVKRVNNKAGHFCIPV